MNEENLKSICARYDALVNDVSKLLSDKSNLNGTVNQALARTIEGKMWVVNLLTLMKEQELAAKKPTKN